ncbi:2OG-Fe(II) oxygenase [Cyanobacteria bacterium FACHB-471]|nr:2OG-Fe(II) oxygenase [Cyanobacteria bacterium FACHB-471]
MSLLTTGDPAPWFVLPSTSNPNYIFDTVGGHRVILCFLGSSKLKVSAAVLEKFCKLQQQFEQSETPFFGVFIDPDDASLAHLVQNPTYFKLLWDFEQKVSLQYGVCGVSNEEGGDRLHYAPTTFVLDENLRVLQTFPIQDPTHHVAQVLDFVQALPVEAPRFASRQAPVLLIPNVFDRDFCQHLIHLYETKGSRDSGFMRQVDGKTVEVMDYEFKQRRDFLVEDPPLLEQVNHLILRRVKPEIEKAFQFSISRFERYLVACYESTNQGFFNRHRDNTTKGTAHRRFAMSLNLNTGDYEGGCLSFPEYGNQLYQPGVGEAIIFSCSLLHEATPVTSGRRFVLLSFFYNDEDAKLREQNRRYVVLNSETNPTPKASSTQPQKSSLGFQPKNRKKR